MTDILTWLEKQTRREKTTPEYRAAMRPYETLNKALAEAMGLKFEAELNAAHADLADLENAEAFARGFRLGAQLFSAAMLAR